MVAVEDAVKSAVLEDTLVEPSEPIKLDLNNKNNSNNVYAAFESIRDIKVIEAIEVLEDKGDSVLD